MSYVPTNWQDFPNLSTAITAARLNNMESGISAAVTSTTAAGSAGLLAARPAAATAGVTFYYATDQDVLYFSDATSWYRTGVPVGATTVQYTSAAAPTGWVKYDGGTLGGSTGIYAALYAHLGSTTTLPDTQGRYIVSLGSNADISTVGNSDGLTLANRSPKHNTSVASVTATPSLTLPNHLHSAGTYAGTITDPAIRDGGSVTGPDAAGSAVNQATSVTIAGNSGNPTSLPAIAGTVGIGGAGGPGGSRPTDAGAFITFGVLIAKL